jgi:hypothetical protein
MQLALARQAMIPALLAQDLKSTIVLYHETFGTTCECMPII